MMKKYLILLSITIFLFSCGGNTEKQSGRIYTDITISMDTVVVDAGNEILMAATSSELIINEAGKKLFFWDVQSFQLELIDLEKLVLKEKRPFERE
ncbi:DUF4221 family protein, partial [Belliella pelovolcani]|uniref:DUF4221 family protein n=1 Tax=Belliella pelovolcani TaxID=529505 RepID=UPI0039191DB9